jgi:long-subunit acyl-CoA synthetase (AMP-forming)
LNWKDRFYQSLRGKPRPVFVFGDSIISGANLWTGARVWTRAFREAGLMKGDRVLIAVEPCQSFLWILIAALCEELSIALSPPGLTAEELETTRTLIDSAATVVSHPPVAGEASSAWSHLTKAPDVLIVDACTLPDFTGWRAHKTAIVRDPEIRLLLRTSGSVASPRFIALSDRNVFSVIDSHHERVDFSDAVLLSVLPWHHAFGLVLELLPALLFQAEVFRDPAGGRDPADLAESLDSRDFTHLNAVPATFEGIFASLPRDRQLEELRGIVGGAPVSADLAERLRGTRLRAGYGQTQAGPGIMLGEPGEWETGFLGRPIGCELRLASDGELEFRGANVCLGEWKAGGLVRGAGENEFFPTGDIVENRGDKYYFQARKGFAFKLPNGRWFHPETLEVALKTRLRIASPVLVLPNPADGRLLILCGDPEAVVKIESELRFANSGAAVTGGGVAEAFPGRTYVAAVRYLPIQEFVLRPKGDIDRRAMSERIATDWNESGS